MLNDGWPIDGLNVGYLENGNTELSLGVLVPINALTGRLSLWHLDRFCFDKERYEHDNRTNWKQIGEVMRLTD
jgi:hypothetical protein